MIMFLLQLLIQNLKMLEENHRLTWYCTAGYQNTDPITRRSRQSLAGVIGIPRSTIGWTKQEKKLRVSTLSSKLKLNNDHLYSWMYHCISKIDKNTITGTTSMKWQNMYNEVHTDEKWFYLVKIQERTIILVYTFTSVIAMNKWSVYYYNRNNISVVSLII
jgi:hypothetical protein